MELYVLDQNYNKIGVIDDYESIIWTTRYYEAGDFELQLPASSQNVELLIEDNYIRRFDDDTVMIIEKIHVETDIANGNYIIAAGRCLKSLLDRRVCWKLQSYRGTPEACMRDIVTRNIISPSIAARKIDNFILGESKGFSGSMEAQFTGDNVLDAVVNICKSYGLGFKVSLNDSNNFVFDIYQGADRSHLQADNLPVVFSPDNGNIIQTTYEKNKQYYKNTALIAGEGEGTARAYNSVGTASGLKRREMFVDANDIKTEVEDEEGNKSTLTAAQYNAALAQRGNENLSEVAVTEVFEGSVDTSILYVYKEDFFLGDIVSAVNDYGIKAAPQITEIIESENSSGYSVIPTFDGWGEEEE